MTTEAAAGRPDEQVMTGAEALAQGAVAAQVGLVTGYPGAPATAVYAALEAAAPVGCERYWAPNEKVAMEVAIGASLAGVRSLVVLKSVGLNIGLDPLATASQAGCHAGLVILLGDDPGGWNSQNEQDSRWLALTAEVPLVEPIDVSTASSFMVQAFAWSESIGLPIVVRVVSSFVAREERVAPPWELPPSHKRFARRENRWVVVPAQVPSRHRSLHRKLRLMQHSFDASPYDKATLSSSLGIIGVGGVYAKVCHALGEGADAYSLLGLTSTFPLPEQALKPWLLRCTRVLVIEEGGAFVEGQVRALISCLHLQLQVIGRQDGALPEEGELTEPDITAAVRKLDPGSADQAQTPRQADMRTELPSQAGLCDGCQYVPFFATLDEALAELGGRGHFLLTGETGCMVRAHGAGVVRLDVKLSLGASLGLALGLAEGRENQRVVALAGDSCFLHSELNTLPLAVDRGLDLTLLVLDNGVTGLTGGQPHPGSGEHAARMDALCRACGAEPVRVAVDDTPRLKEALVDALQGQGVKVVLISAPCTHYAAEGDA